MRQTPALKVKIFGEVDVIAGFQIHFFIEYKLFLFIQSWGEPKLKQPPLLGLLLSGIKRQLTPEMKTIFGSKLPEIISFGNR